MGNIIRKLLFSLGSTKVHMVPFRDYMVWVATVRGRTWAEAIIDDTPGEDGYYGAPVMVDVAIPLSSLGKKLALLPRISFSLLKEYG